mmetsp:Transcript_14366/g.45866  ORF Transcript_14366/g.45866 Transcript_14366/m.45866 type:complete len:215 (-) Transcript_14366:620-1264(-)
MLREVQPRLYSNHCPHAKLRLVAHSLRIVHIQTQVVRHPVRVVRLVQLPAHHLVRCHVREHAQTDERVGHEPARQLLQRSPVHARLPQRIQACLLAAQHLLVHATLGIGKDTTHWPHTRDVGRVAVEGAPSVDQDCVPRRQGRIVLDVMDHRAPRTASHDGRIRKVRGPADFARVLQRRLDGQLRHARLRHRHGLHERIRGDGTGLPHVLQLCL